MNEILSKVKNLNLNILKISDNFFNGNYRSIFKGNGIDFSEYKKYEYGDDTKYIDWKVSLRKGVFYKRKFIEERNINVILVVDISSSMFFFNKKDILFNFSLIISYLTLKNNDNLSLITFCDNVIDYFKPQKTKNNFLNIINYLSNMHFKENRKTNIKACLEFINKTIRKKSVIFFISDFISNIDYEKEIKICSHKHDFISVVIDIKEENILNNTGIIKVYNPENNKYILIDTSLNNDFYLYSKENKENLLNLFNKNSIDSLFLNNDDFLLELNNFFKFRRAKVNVQTSL